MKKPAFLILVASFAARSAERRPWSSAQEPVNLVFLVNVERTEGQRSYFRKRLPIPSSQPNCHHQRRMEWPPNQTLVRTALSAGRSSTSLTRTKTRSRARLMREGFGLPLSAYLDQAALDHEERCATMFLPARSTFSNLEGETYLIPYIYKHVAVLVRQAHVSPTRALKPRRRGTNCWRPVMR